MHSHLRSFRANIPEIPFGVCVSLLPSLNFEPECIPINIALKALETVHRASRGSLSGFYYVSFELLASPYFSGVVGAGQENGS